MNTWLQRVGGGWLLSTVLIGCLGCSKSDPEPYAASGGAEPATADPNDAETGGSQPPLETEESTDSAAADLNDTDLNRDSAAAAGTPTETPTDQGDDDEPFAQMLPPPAARDVATPFTLEGSEATEPKTASLTELRADLSPKQLQEFLSVADSDMQLIVTGRSGIKDPKQARRTLLHIVKMKLEASRRLTTHADADEPARSEGARGELQSLSHLAVLGNVKAAEELEGLAQSRMESEDPLLVADSRLVLIGFALEGLQNGEEDAPERILRFVDQIAESPTPPDVAAMMVMGEARDMLDRYGHDQQARDVRDRIIELFADSPEPQIAEMAARLAGNVRFDGIDGLLNQAIDGTKVEKDQWSEAVQTLIQESADLQTVQYLSGAAVEFESHGLAELASATYELMAKSFTEPSAATTQEAAMVREAYLARQAVRGQIFSPDLESVDGAQLSLKDYRGKVVLIPFWAMNFPPSLQVLPQLRTIAEQYPDQVAIVGVNLDAAGEPVAEFVKASQLGFPSFRATNEMTNQIATKFGIVSMPFTAIVDREGRVADIDFKGQKLESVVTRLLAP